MNAKPRRDIRKQVGKFFLFACPSSSPSPLTLPPPVKHQALPTLRFSLGRETEKWNVHPKFWLFRGLPKGLGSVLPESVCWWEKNGCVLWIPGWGQLKTMASTTACYTRKTAVLQTDTRERRRLWASEKQQRQTSLTGKSLAQVQRRRIPRRGLRGSQISS